MFSELTSQIKRFVASYMKPDERNFDSKFTRLDTSANIFDEGVTQFFEPLAKRIKLPLQKLKDGIYEIAGETFTMRIRRGIGHSRDFLVTLSEKSSTPLSPDELGREVGLGVIAEFNGQKLGTHKLHTTEGYLAAFAEAAKAAERYCAPYLLDLRSHLGEIRRVVEQKIEDSGLRPKKHRFPPNVREEWL